MNIEQLYKDAYVSKEASGWYDFINFIRELLGMSYINSPGDTAAAIGAGAVGAGAAGAGAYAGYKYLSQDPNELIQPALGAERRAYRKKNFAQGYKPTQQDIDNYKVFRKDAKNRLMNNFNKSTRGKIYNSSLGTKVRALPKGGKWAGLVGGALAAGGLAGSIYDGLVNRH